MDKQISLLKAAIEEIEYTLNSNKDSEVKGIYLSNAVRFISSVIVELDRREQDSISKTKLLEWLKEKNEGQSPFSSYGEGMNRAREVLIEEIKAGTFDRR